MPERLERGLLARITRSLGEHYRIIHANPLSRIGFWVVSIFTIVAIFAPWLTLKLKDAHLLEDSGVSTQEEGS